MSPQPSNRAALVEGALHCLATMPLDRVSARALASASGANLASIGYHFGSKEGLVTAALVEGLDRWLERISEHLDGVGLANDPVDRFRQAAEAVDDTRSEHDALARAFAAALARGLHDDAVAAHLREGFLRTRPRVAQLLGLGEDETGTDAGAIVHAIFTGLLVQTLLSGDLALDADRTTAALHRLAETVTGDQAGGSKES